MPNQANSLQLPPGYRETVNALYLQGEALAQAQALVNPAVALQLANREISVVAWNKAHGTAYPTSFFFSYPGLDIIANRTAPPSTPQTAQAQATNSQSSGTVPISTAFPNVNGGGGPSVDKGSWDSSANMSVATRKALNAQAGKNIYYIPPGSSSSIDNSIPNESIDQVNSQWGKPVLRKP